MVELSHFPSHDADGRENSGRPDEPHEPEAAFAGVVALRRLANRLERSAVDRALGQGWTWAQIGQALGISAQAAHKKLAPARR